MHFLEFLKFLVGGGNTFCGVGTEEKKKVDVRASGPDWKFLGPDCPQCHN